MNEFQNLIDLVHSMRSLALDRDSAGHVEKKGDADFVTAVDFGISTRIREALKEMYPGYGFFSEEEAGSLSDPCFILDPIDGTTNLLFDYQMSSVSLGLYQDGRIVFGVVYNPFTEETFTAKEGEGAYLSKAFSDGSVIRKKLQVSSHEPSAALVEFGAGSTHKELTEENFEIVKSVFREVLDVRRICSSALDLCYIAAGRIDGYFERVLKPWDVAAGSLILKEAGGVITDYEGNPIQYAEKTSVVASNGLLQDFLLRKVSRKEENA